MQYTKSLLFKIIIAPLAYIGFVILGVIFSRILPKDIDLEAYDR